MPIEGLIQFGANLQTIRGDLSRIDEGLHYAADERCAVSTRREQENFAKPPAAPYRFPARPLGVDCRIFAVPASFFVAIPHIWEAVGAAGLCIETPCLERPSAESQSLTRLRSKAKGCKLRHYPIRAGFLFLPGISRATR